MVGVDPIGAGPVPGHPGGHDAPTGWRRLAVVWAFLTWASRAGWCDLACSDVIRPARQRRPARLAPWSVEDCRRLLAVG
ncbi:MAG: hypothetical protein ACYCTZ_09935 [Candidatus Dormibacteria bacterium]